VASLHWSRLHISLLWIYQGRVPQPTRAMFDAFPSMTAWLVRKGTVEVTVGERCDRASSGQWIFPKPVARFQRFSPDAEILSVRFRIEWPNGDQLFSEGMGVTLPAREHPDLERAARRLERVVQSLTKTRFHDASFTGRNLDFLEFLRVEKAVIGWSETVYRSLLRAGLKPNLQLTGDSRIQAILQALDAWPLHEAFRAEEFARRTGVSRSNLDRITMRSLGTSSKAYMDRRRIRYALQCLQQPDVPVKQIAMETGFRHASSFCTWFRNKTGRYPGEMESI